MNHKFRVVIIVGLTFAVNDVLAADGLTHDGSSGDHKSAEHKSDAGEERAESVRPERIGFMLQEGAKVMRNGQVRRAIAEFFDPVLDYFKRSSNAPNTRYYSAHGMKQSLIYAALKGKEEENTSVEVLGPEWSDAYLLKAYALIELGNIAEAQEALHGAIVLSPLTAQYFSELGYTYQAQKNCDKSLEAYQQAESVVDLGSEEDSKVSDKTRALRGQGYCLVEKGKWDEAIATYQRCLELDPDDQRAKAELQYANRMKQMVTVEKK